MTFKNANSKRKNPFNGIYESPEFKTVLERRNDVRGFPYLVDIELTNHCNLKCVFCSQQTMKRAKGFVSGEIFKKVVDECAKHNTPVRFIRFGEPFLHPDIIDFCKYVKSKGLFLHITNNGLAIKESDMQALVEIEVDSLIFSFQGATKSEYELMRNNRLYDKLRSNIKKMIEIRGNKEKPFIHISSTATDEPENEIHDFGNYWSNIADSVGIGKTTFSRLSENQKSSFETMGKLELLVKKETIKKEYRPCTEVYQKLSVDWDGKISACCSDSDNFLTLADISETSLNEVWNKSQKLKKIRKLLDAGMHKSLILCKTCYHAYEDF